jgi:trehalose-phosphatase
VTPAAAGKLGAFFETFAGELHPLLLLDYDGTLAPFRVDRFEARPWAGVRDLLTRIQRQGQTRMAVITGRPAAEIGPLLGLESAIEVWGLHGAERLYPDGRRELEAAPVAAEQLLNELRERLRRDPLGGLFENKPNACVMHWRGASPHTARAIEKRARRLFEPLAEIEGLGLLEFEAGLELRVGRDKGGAVEAILAEAEARLNESGTAGPVAYLGDDLTDEAAIRVVNLLEGAHLSVLIRRAYRDTAADIWLRPPAELREFLEMWLRAVEGRGSNKHLAADEELATV